MIKKGLFPSLALKTAPLRGRQMQAASLHLISKTNKTAVQDIQWSSYMFFTCWIQCQLSRCSHVKSMKNIHDGFGDSGTVFQGKPNIPQHQMADFHGFQVTRVVCTFPMKNMITSWLHVEVQIFDFFFFVYS